MANPMSPPRRDEGDMSRPGQFATEVKNKAQETGAGLADKGKEFASSVSDTAGQMATAVGQKARDVASSVGQKAEDATSGIGSRMESLGGTLREKAPHEGLVGTAASSIADTLECGGRYLQEEGLSGLGAEFVQLVRRNPIPALFVAMGLGYLIARATRR